MSKNEQWDLKRLGKAMKESKKEFFALQERLINLMVDYGLRALKSFEACKEGELNPMQINQVVTKEIQSVIANLLEPDFADIIIRKAEHDFLTGRSEPLKL